MKFIKKYYLYMLLIFVISLLFTSLVYLFVYNQSDKEFVEWKLTPVYRGSGFDKLIYNITINNIGNAKAEYVKMYIYQENNQGNFEKGDFTGGNSYEFKPLEAATFEYGVNLKKVKSYDELIKVRKSVRLDVQWKEKNITNTKTFVLEPNPL